MITLSARLRTPIEINSAVEQLTNNIFKAAQLATPKIPASRNHKITYPMEVGELVKEKRKARKNGTEREIFQIKLFGTALSRLLHDKIREVKNETFKSYLSKISAMKDTDYALWKATKQMKRPRAHVPPICQEDGSWARSDQDKAETYARHLERVFQPNNIISQLETEQCQPLYEIRERIKHFTPIEIAKEIDMNINLKKAPGYDQINPKILK